MNLGSIGIWSGALRMGERSAIIEAVQELEELGYGAVWFPGGNREGLTEHLGALLGATKRVPLATGIVNIWTHPAKETAADTVAIQRQYPGRYMLGLGVSHHIVVERAGMTYEKPLARMKSYLT